MDVVALLSAHFEDIAESLRRQKSEPAPAPFDNCIRDKRGTMHDVANIREWHCKLLQQRFHAFQCADRGVGGGR